MKHKVKVKGHQGDWIASVEGYGRVACIHADMCRWDPELKRQVWRDEWSCRWGGKKGANLIEAIRDRGLVVTTKDDVTYDETGRPDYKRRGYIALWRVGDFQIEDGTMTAVLQDRLEECR